jgi:hypothetical protein
MQQGWQRTDKGELITKETSERIYALQDFFMSKRDNLNEVRAKFVASENIRTV